MLLSADLKTIRLPAPEEDGGNSVMAALRERRTVRAIRPTRLSTQMLSNLLWAAFGVNREEEKIFGKPGRTAASASNSQEIDLYVAAQAGGSLYEAVPHALVPVSPGDFRERANNRGFSPAPVVIFYVVDLSRFDTGPGQPDPHMGEQEIQKSYYFTDTGLIAQNVHLFAASQGLAAWFHNCDRQNTVNEFKLRPDQQVLFAQSVGYPA